MIKKERLICWFGLLSTIIFLVNMTLLLSSEAEFTPTGSLETARYAHTATLLSNGKVLIVGGASGNWTSAELYDPMTGTFLPTGSMGTPRVMHSATLLPSGKVLIVGGCSGPYPMTTYSSAELYDPAIGTFSPTGSMGTSRAGHTATLLPSGEVLIASGHDQWEISSTNSAELYDPATCTFKSTGSLLVSRGLHIAVLLPNGKVLITGGGDIYSTAELYDPATGAFTFTDSMAVGRNYHRATLLPNGKVLIAAGEGSSKAPLDSAELYDPTTGTFWDACCSQVPRERHTATLLPCGKVLLTGTGPGWPGEPGHPLSPVDAASAELYDPATGTFSPTGSMGTARFVHSATLLPSGKVLIVGGADVNGLPLASAELYVDPTNVPNYTVNFAAGNGGSLTGITTQTVEYGGNCTTVEAVPNTGYQFVNWTGTGGFVTTTDNPLTVTNVTANMTITAHFLLSNPAGWTPSENLQYNMIAYGKAYNGNNPAAVGDWIAAFGPGGAPDCRGAAAVQANGNYVLIVGSNVTSGETISFKLWPLPSGPALDGSETVDFIDNNVYNGLSLHFGPRGQNIALVNGWNWVSFNVLPVDTSLNSVFTGLTGIVEQVKSQSQAAIYSGGSWIGDLTDMSGIANGIMYKVKTIQDCVVTVNGSTIPFNQPLSLITGWNWTAYLPSLKQPLEDAIASIMTPVSQIKSQYRAVIKIGSSLYGDLTDMEPNKGYTILMSTPGTLVYPYAVVVFPDGARGRTTATKTQAVSWPLIKGNQYNMVAYGKVFFEGKAISGPGYYLASIGPKGEKDNRSFSPIGTDGSYFSTILGNTGGETIKFKLYNSSNGKTYDVAGSLAFQPDALKPAYNLKARSVKVTAPVGGAIMRTGDVLNISWDAYEVNNVKIELYKSGRSYSLIASSVPVGSYAYSWTIPDRMPFGNDYQVKVSCVDPGVIAKDLSMMFSIKPTPSISLISPNGGEIWKVKQGVDITWRSLGIDNIKIELYKGTVLKTVISASIPAGTGKYTWIIPANHALGTKFKIKISSVDSGVNLNDISDSWFSIRQ